jgi:hypothetical protein
MSSSRSNMTSDDTRPPSPPLTLQRAITFSEDHTFDCAIGSGSWPPSARLNKAHITASDAFTKAMINLDSSYQPSSRDTSDHGLDPGPVSRDAPVGSCYLRKRPSQGRRRLSTHRKQETPSALRYFTTAGQTILSACGSLVPGPEHMSDYQSDIWHGLF